MQAFKKQMFQINMKCWQENPNWQEADLLAIYTVQQKSWTWGGGGGELRTNPVSSRVEDLNPGPPNFNCSTLTTWACRLQSFNLANSVTYIYKRTTSN